MGLHSRPDDLATFRAVHPDRGPAVVRERDIVSEDFPPEEAQGEDAPIPQKYHRIPCYLLYDEPGDEEENARRRRGTHRIRCCKRM